MSTGFVDAGEMAGILKIPRKTVDRLSREGRIPFLRIGLYRRYVVNEVLEALTKDEKSRSRWEISKGGGDVNSARGRAKHARASKAERHRAGVTGNSSWAESADDSV